jgi:hypothetical protein
MRFSISRSVSIAMLPSTAVSFWIRRDYGKGAGGVDKIFEKRSERCGDACQPGCADCVKRLGRLSFVLYLLAHIADVPEWVPDICSPLRYEQIPGWRASLAHRQVTSVEDRRRALMKRVIPVAVRSEAKNGRPGPIPER